MVSIQAALKIRVPTHKMPVPSGYLGAYHPTEIVFSAFVKKHYY